MIGRNKIMEGMKEVEKEDNRELNREKSKREAIWKGSISIRCREKAGIREV